MLLAREFALLALLLALLALLALQSLLLLALLFGSGSLLGIKRTAVWRGALLGDGGLTRPW